MYKFTIKDYRAIKEATIRIDGITVLAGINGSGKSTLSRWLYYLVNALHGFEHYQRRYFIEALEQQIDKVNRLFRTTPKSSDYLPIRNQMRLFKRAEELDWDAMRGVYFSFVEKAEADLYDYIERRGSNGRLASFLLGRDVPEETGVSDLIGIFIQECRETFEKGLNEYMQKLERYSRKDLESVISAEYSDGEQMPVALSFVENDTSLLEEETFSPPLMLSRAIYIDSPMAVSGRNYYWGMDVWADFLNYLYTDNSQRKEISTVRLLAQIQSVIAGDIKITNDKFEVDKELHYVSNEQGIDINVSDAATGVKTFAYMTQLLRNGWLDKETLLLIDEPEAHLHPQWIVEFARLLVKIHKELGVKVLVASHNPDMVAAIQSIAQKEEVIDKTVFYLAQRGKEEMKYDFVDKGTEISDIFTSFNIAISRIEMYGATIM